MEEILKLIPNDALVGVGGSITVREMGLIEALRHQGNRVAAMIFGPKKVIVVAGVNKIIKNLEGALDRVNNVASPMNAKRLGRKTPCARTGVCTDCRSPERICNVTTIIQRRPIRTDFTLVLVGEELGY